MEKERRNIIIDLDDVEKRGLFLLNGRYYRPRFKIENNRLIIELEEVK